MLESFAASLHRAGGSRRRSRSVGRIAATLKRRTLASPRRSAIRDRLVHSMVRLQKPRRPTDRREDSRARPVQATVELRTFGENTGAGMRKAATRALTAITSAM